jgi:uracil-DNA glycosylase family protein
MLIGEQPGDQEDREGRPFVGPAGELLDRALTEAGIARSDCYVTNAVKHFKWEPRGKRRIHKKPSPREVAACRPWLEAEIRIIHPKTLVCLGATAAVAILGSRVRVLRDRGHPLSSFLAENVFVTVHPSLLLRMPDREAAKKEYQRFVQDLRAAGICSRVTANRA